MTHVQAMQILKRVKAIPLPSGYTANLMPHNPDLQWSTGWSVVIWTPDKKFFLALDGPEDLDNCRVRLTQEVTQ